MSVTHSPIYFAPSPDTLIHTGRYSIDQLLITSSATTATEQVTIRDGTDATAEIRCRFPVWAAPEAQVIRLYKPIVCENGCYLQPGACHVNVWGTGA